MRLVQSTTETSDPDKGSGWLFRPWPIRHQTICFPFIWSTGLQILVQKICLNRAVRLFDMRKRMCHFGRWFSNQLDMDLLRWWLIFSSAVGLVAASRTGFLLTGPKLLLLGSVETFCVSVEVTSTAHCTLDLLATDSDTIYAGTKHRMQGQPTLSLSAFHS